MLLLSHFLDLITFITHLSFVIRPISIKKTILLTTFPSFISSLGGWWGGEGGGERHNLLLSETLVVIFKFQVARAVAESRIKFYFSSNLSRNDFGRQRLLKLETVKCFVQLVPSQFRQNIARQVAHFTV